MEDDYIDYNEESTENEDNEYFNTDEKMDVEAINMLVEDKLSNIRNDNRIYGVHPQIYFNYNSFNVILGKQGTGKTTFILKEMIKLSKINSLYKKIIYVSENEGNDLTFANLKKMISIPIYVMNFENATLSLTKYYEEAHDDHIIVILEDGSFIFEKKNEKWSNWICKLRHLRMTVFLNVHIWRGINPMLKTQISSVVVFKGFSKEIIQRVVSQTSSDGVYQTVLYLYLGMSKKSALFIDNIKGKINLINLF